MAGKAVRLEGVWPIIPTPFDEAERIDPPSLERVVRFMAELGMDGVTVLGVMGEANRVTDAERDEVIRIAVAAAGKMPVCVGATHPGTAACVAYCRTAEALGAAAVMISPSREGTPSEEKIFEFFQRVGAGTTLPIVVQDHPPSSLTFMSVPLLLRLAREIPRVSAIKEEHPPTPVRIGALVQGLKDAAGHQVTVLQGLGALFGLYDLQRGGHGFMTGFAFPEVLAVMVRAARAGQMERVQALYQRFLPLMVYEQQPGVAIRKEVYRLRGLIASNRVRHPGGAIDPGTAAQLRSVLDAVLPGVDLTRPLAL